MSERTRHTKPIPFPITKLTCSNKHEKVVSTTAKTVTLNQKRGKIVTTENNTQHKHKHKPKQHTIMAEKRKPRFRIFRKIRTLNESETPIREKNDQTNPPMNSQRNKNETLNRWKELALFCSRNLGGW